MRKRLDKPILDQWQITARSRRTGFASAYSASRIEGGNPALRDQHRRELKQLREVAADGGNVMPALIEASEALATVGEMMNTLKDVYGQYDGGPEL